MSLIAVQKIDDNCDEVGRICYPLFNKTPLDFFGYVRYYDSGEALYLSSEPDIQSSWILQGLYPTRSELDMFVTFGLKTTYLSPEAPLPLGGEVSPEKYENVIAVAYDHKLFHLLYFVKRVSNYYRVCGFGTQKQSKHIINFYISASPFLEKFIPYFEENADHLIEPSQNKGHVVLPIYHMPSISNPAHEICQDFNHKLDFCEVIGVKKCLSGITNREEECLRLIAHGHTMKTAAKKLEISNRTVEQHLRNVKDKFGLNTKSQLVELWRDNIGDD